MNSSKYLFKNRMAKIKIAIYIIVVVTSVYSCQTSDKKADAYGNFEATTIVISPESTGRLLYFSVAEGQILEKDIMIGLIDTVPLFLKKQQIAAGMKSLKSQLQDPEPQIDLIRKQISVLEKEKSRIEALLSDNAAPTKQLDDLQGQISLLHKQVETLGRQAKIANNAILGQTYPLESQINQIDDQIQRSYIKNPVYGTVILKLAQAGEIVSPTRPLYTIANMDTLELRAYISGAQLPHIRLGQEITVQIDQDKNTNSSLNGTVSWISQRAEFTPRTIQTKEERVNQVYAFKVRVPNNDSRLKIGMPGEVHFETNHN
jgi:HlyD family secretion protein